MALQADGGVGILPKYAREVSSSKQPLSLIKLFITLITSEESCPSISEATAYNPS